VVGATKRLSAVRWGVAGKHHLGMAFNNTCFPAATSAVIYFP